MAISSCDGRASLRRRAKLRKWAARIVESLQRVADDVREWSAWRLGMANPIRRPRFANTSFHLGTTSVSPRGRDEQLPVEERRNSDFAAPSVSTFQWEGVMRSEFEKLVFDARNQIFA